MSLQKLQHIPLKFAYLCQDCNAIGNSSRQCPACASEVLLSLAVVLNREEREATPQSPYVIRRPLLAA
jgi:predicted RNA-binding protein with PUA domain